MGLIGKQAQPPYLYLNFQVAVGLASTFARCSWLRWFFGPGSSSFARHYSSVFEHLPYDAAVRDVNRDLKFQCLSANRTEFVAEAPSATYVWSLNAGENKPREHTALLYTAGDAPDKFFTMIASECTLWVTYDKRYSYPEECDKKHFELCGEGVSLFDKELCGDDDAL
ncbi:hypothetical protein HPB50_005545 [Hyalomma asiaticum]|uniref:Uncharacterized protein n=1 Tax=Hyalomma asiaticum TaxID=266040 RepID=A0ACB7S1K4_HYAAI|nr:hypothetical protein HPB50_005545 [Hyalomma asiaticum]